MPIIYDTEKDRLYLKGFEKGLEKSIIVCHEMGAAPYKIAENFEISLQMVLRAIRLNDQRT